MKKKIILTTVAVCFLFIGTYTAPVSAFGNFYPGIFCKDKVTVMTRNLYLGADIFKVVEAAQDPDPGLGGLDVPIAVAELFQTVQYTNFPERAKAIAREIWLTRPHLIGLQEVSSWYIQSPSDFFMGQTTATELVYDYLEILLEALAALGLHYEVAASGTNADVELPMLTNIPGNPEPAPTFDDLRMVDRNVILVRSDVDWSNPDNQNYENNVSETIGGVKLEFTRGWVAIDAEVCGTAYRFVNTHLEISSDPDSIFRVIQAAQMQELLAILSNEPNPIILVGDFNSSPEHVPGYGCLPEDSDCYPYVPPYLLATMYAGYLDAWDLILWPRDGFTSGFDEFVSDPTAELTERIDLVLLKPQKKKINRVIGITTGDRPFSMTPSGLWPSDHAGVVDRINFEHSYR